VERRPPGSIASPRARADAGSIVARYRTPNVWFPVTQPGPYGPDPGTGGCGADCPTNSWITLRFSGTERISPPFGSPPRRQ
jgi:hypothetical protein